MDKQLGDFENSFQISIGYFIIVQFSPAGIWTFLVSTYSRVSARSYKKASFYI